MTSAPPAVRTLRLGGVSTRVGVRGPAVVAGLAALTLLTALAAVATGDFPIPLDRVLLALAGAGSPLDQLIVVTLRVPRELTAAMVGAALGIGGATFQTLFRNPLASPDIVGFTSGAATGALVSILLAGDRFAGAEAALATAAGAVLGGIATSVAISLLAAGRGGRGGYRLILIGIGVTAMLTATNWYLLTRADVNDAARALVWLTGSLNGRGWEHVVPLAVAFAALLPPLTVIARRLPALELGDEAAGGLGVRVGRTRVQLMLLAVALTGAAVAAAGPIAFVALASPQVARRLTRGSGAGLAAAAGMGALLVVLSDLVAQRLFASAQVPVGVVTLAVGGGYLAWLLGRERRRGRL